MPSERAEPATASLFIVNPLAGGGSLLQLFSTHPSVVERVHGLRAMAQDMGVGPRWARFPAAGME